MMQKKAVIGIIFNPNRSEVLLIKRRDVPVWVFPGGGVEQGEKLSTAILREVMEETGLTVKVKKKIAEYTPLNKLCEYTEVFECEPVAGSLQTGDETREIGYFPLTQLPSSFFIVHHDWLNDALENQSEIIKKPIKRVTFWELFKYFCRHPIHVIRFALSKLGMPINS